MAIPWVSRELYDKVCEQLKQSEIERKILLDRLLGTPAIEDVIASVLPDPKSTEAEELLDQGTGKLTIEGLRGLAQRTANKRAGKA